MGEMWNVTLISKDTWSYIIFLLAHERCEKKRERERENEKERESEEASFCWTDIPESTNWMGNITVQLTSCLFCFKLTALFKLNEQQFYLFGQIQTNQTGGQPYNDTSPSVSVL